jgi:hypothetical protein
LMTALDTEGERWVQELIYAPAMPHLRYRSLMPSVKGSFKHD